MSHPKISIMWRGLALEPERVDATGEVQRWRVSVPWTSADRVTLVDADEHQRQIDTFSAWIDRVAPSSVEVQIATDGIRLVVEGTAQDALAALQRCLDDLNQVGGSR